MLYLIGLGLGDETDITVKGLEIVKRCKKVYLEAYTSILGVSKEKLELFYGRPVEIATREVIESEIDEAIIQAAKTEEIAVLIVGDPFGATTHSDIILRAHELQVPVQVVHNASIMNAAGVCGLQLYRFGQSITVVFFTENWRPDSFYPRILANRREGLHTLCLLDIKVREVSEENMARGRKIYEPPRYMTNNLAIEQLLEVEDRLKQNAYGPDTYCVGLARVGQSDQRIVSGAMKDLLRVDFGGPLHCFIIGGDLHPMEKDHADLYLAKESDFKKADA